MNKEEIYFRLKQVPKGKVITYRDLARSFGSRAARFIGKCMKENSNPDDVPCFKVIRSDGFVGEYSGGGRDEKVRRLRAEGIGVVEGRVDLGRFGFKFRI